MRKVYFLPCVWLCLIGVVSAIAQDGLPNHDEDRERKIRQRSIERRKFAPGLVESVHKLFPDIPENKLEHNLTDSLYLIDAVTKDYETKNGEGPSERMRELVGKMKAQFSRYLDKKTDLELHDLLIKVSAKATDAYLESFGSEENTKELHEDAMRYFSLLRATAEVILETHGHKSVSRLGSFLENESDSAKLRLRYGHPLEKEGEPHLHHSKELVQKWRQLHPRTIEIMPPNASGGSQEAMYRQTLLREINR